MGQTARTDTMKNVVYFYAAVRQIENGSFNLAHGSVDIKNPSATRVFDAISEHIAKVNGWEAGGFTILSLSIIHTEDLPNEDEEPNHNHPVT